MNLRFLLALICLALTACANTSGTKLEIKDTQIVYNVIPNEVLSPCIPASPIQRDVYLSYSPVERERYLSNYIVELYGTIKICNDKLGKARELNSAVPKERQYAN